ncbi:hypothetical protein E1H18_2974 [Caulobacter sp. RHG1]|nr:hypothetical protein [Caulobacter sp. RHG1]
MERQGAFLHEPLGGFFCDLLGAGPRRPPRVRSPKPGGRVHRLYGTSSGPGMIK